MIQILVCEKNAERIEQLRSALQQYSQPLKQEVKVYWLYGSRMEAEMEKYISTSNIAIISMELPNGMQLASLAHRRNSLCRLVLLGGNRSCLEQWIPSGPVSFCDTLARIPLEMNRLTQELSADGNLFSFVTRREKRFIPYRQITYFQSNLRYVEVITNGENIGRFQGKLDQVQDAVFGAKFIRIHQSYLVNEAFISGIDFASHEVILSSGEKLPCSTKYYAEVCARLNALTSP